MAGSRFSPGVDCWTGVAGKVPAALRSSEPLGRANTNCNRGRGNGRGDNLLRVESSASLKTANLGREALEVQKQCLDPRPARGVGPGAVLYCPLAGA
jgi:hypothetical protein